MNNEELLKTVEEGFTQLGNKVRNYAIAVASGDADLQSAAYAGANIALEELLDGIYKDVATRMSSAQAGPNSRQKVSESVNAVVTSPNGKTNIGGH